MAIASQDSGHDSLQRPYPLHPEMGEERSLLKGMDYYFNLREAAAAAPIPSDEVIGNIQQDVVQTVLGDDKNVLGDELEPEELRPRYGVYVPESLDRLAHLNTFLRIRYGHIIPKEVLDASDAFIAMVRDMHDAHTKDERIDEGAEGRFAFIVPARAERSRPEDSTETIGPCPSLRYVPDGLRVAMYAGLPPFVVDRYERGDDGRPAYMVLAPVFPDMKAAFPDSQTEVVRRARQAVNDAVQFAHDVLGVEIAGLGASLPAVTHYGKSIEVPGVVTTTGHAGTIALIMETIQALRDKGEVSEQAIRRIGILGVGSIGESIARVVADLYPGSEMVIYDPDTEKANGVVESVHTADQEKDPKTRRLVVRAESMREVLEGSGLVISAVPGRLNLDDPKLAIGRLDGLRVIDDSQPWAITTAQMAEHGGKVVWVAGEDPRAAVAQRSSHWNYGGTLLPNSEFGCALEAAVLANILTQIRRDSALMDVLDGPYDGDDGLTTMTALDLVGSYALRDRVTPSDALRFYDLFKAHGIRAATLQAEGTPINPADLDGEDAQTVVTNVISITERRRKRPFARFARVLLGSII